MIEIARKNAGIVIVGNVAPGGDIIVVTIATMTTMTMTAAVIVAMMMMTTMMITAAVEEAGIGITTDATAVTDMFALVRLKRKGSQS